ncbi:MAG TPA: acyl carrier protein [Candidatus Manganitrophaceae bacterium]|nr:acyl carrier protein [Candidatus Manganitrophaceae bacterium]
MSDQEKIKQFLIDEICADQGLDIREIAEEDDLVDSGVLDSLSILKLLSFLDEEYQIDISADAINLDAFKTLESILRLIGESKGK